MTAFVADCSVTASWVLPDEVSERASDLIGRLGSDAIFVPFLWPSEIANVLLMAERRGRLTPTQRDAAFAELKKLPIVVVPFDYQADWAATYALADRFGLTFYDACYVRLAAQSGEALATFDKQMRTAAEALGLSLAI